MAMQHCRKCLENNWRFENIEGIIRATCNMCENEIEFVPRIKTNHKPIRRKELLMPVKIPNKDNCKKCGGRLFLHPMKKPSKIFENYNKCEDCRTVYFNNKK